MRTVFTAFTLSWALVCPAIAATESAVTQEIKQLLARLEASGCEFNRNGSWHSAVEAKTHLLRKLDYLQEKTPLTSTEQFITLAATASSMTGQAYQVRCAGAESLASAAWLGKALTALREQK